jgi:hypothetical protein
MYPYIMYVLVYIYRPPPHASARLPLDPPTSSCTVASSMSHKRLNGASALRMSAGVSPAGGHTSGAPSSSGSVEKTAWADT